jgi:hypothetical protein
LAPLIGAASGGPHSIGFETDECVERRRLRAPIEQRLGQRLRGKIAGADRGRRFRGTELSERWHRKPPAVLMMGYHATRPIVTTAMALGNWYSSNLRSKRVGLIC